MNARTYFLVNRAWWAAALFLAPVVAAIIGTPVAGLIAGVVLLLPTVVVFDTDASWWSSEVRMLPQDQARSRIELRLLTMSAGVGLVLGVVIAHLVG